jgi:hypothetical protein
VIVASWRTHVVCDRTRPFRVDPVLKVTVVLAKRMPSIYAHLHQPRPRPPRAPAPIFFLAASKLVRPAALVYAVCMSLTAAAVVNTTAGVVPPTYFAAKTLPPGTCKAVEKSLVAAKDKPKPVMAAAAMGETTMSPVMTEFGTVEMPVFARLA